MTPLYTRSVYLNRYPLRQFAAEDVFIERRRVLLSSQNLCDFGTDKFSQIKGAQFISIDDHPKDARIFKTRHHRLPEYIQSLRKYDFVDLTDRHLLHEFNVFRITRLPDLNDEITSADENKFSVKPVKAKPGREKVVKLTDEELENELLDYLTDHASYVSELGRELSEKTEEKWSPS